jgi:radical SAM superfamily enzyme YgiQ (UPF0313 family)
MRIAVINPPRVEGHPVVREERYEHKDVGAVYPPIGLLTVAALLELEGHELLFRDASGFDLSWDALQQDLERFQPELVFARCGFDTQDEDLRLLRFAKQHLHSVTVIRNTIIGETPWLRRAFLEKYPFTDIFLTCEPESSIVGLVRHIAKNGLKDLASVPGASFLENGAMREGPQPELVTDLDRLPLPAWHLMPSLKPFSTGVLESPMALVNTTRGCPFTCTFCAYRKTGYRTRSPENVITELKLLKEKHGLKSFLFFDDVIGLQKGRFERICELMIQENLGLKWACCSRANLVNLELLKLMKRAGCLEIAFGIESGDEAVLDATTKRITLDEIRTAAKLCRKSGILFYGLAIIGLPGETKESVKNTVKFIKSIRPFYTQFCFSTPFPNTEIYKYYEEKGFLLTKDWKRYSPLSPDPVVRTEALSAEELKEMRQYVYRSLLLDPIYLLRQVRLFDWRWNISGFIKIMGRIGALLFKGYIR